LAHQAATGILTKPAAIHHI